MDIYRSSIKCWMKNGSSLSKSHCRFPQFTASSHFENSLSWVYCWIVFMKIKHALRMVWLNFFRRDFSDQIILKVREKFAIQLNYTCFMWKGQSVLNWKFSIVLKFHTWIFNWNFFRSQMEEEASTTFLKGMKQKPTPLS